MAILAISVAPANVGDHLTSYVAKAVQVARDDERVTVSLGSMFTTLEGELGACFEVAQKMHEAMFEAGAMRVSTVLKIDDRRDRKVRMEDKTKSVEAWLAGQVPNNYER